MIGFPKPPRGEYAAERKARQRQHKEREAATMRAVKAEDGHACRVPNCKAKTVEVAHAKHRSMGGNPTEDRTTPDQLITLCIRHHDMWDRVQPPDLDIVPLTNRQFRGPCEFLIDGLFYARERTHHISETRSAL